MGLVSGGAVFSSIEADPDLIWPVPDHWSLEDAASVPLPYVYAYYCLVCFLYSVFVCFADALILMPLLLSVRVEVLVCHLSADDDDD